MHHARRSTARRRNARGPEFLSGSGITMLALWAALAVGVAACGSGDATGPDPDPDPDPGSGPDPVDARSFALGFTDFPHALSGQALADAYGVIEADADLVALHFDGGIPWQEALDGAPYPDGWVAELEAKGSLVPPGHDVYLAVTPLSGDRSGLALNRGEAGEEPLPPPWDGRAFDDPAVIAAFGNHVERMVARYDPDYLAIAIEANMLFTADPGQWDALVQLLTTVRARLVTSRPGLPVFATVQAEFFYRDPAAQEPAVLDLFALSDVVAVSAYPYLDRAPVATVPADYFDAIRELAPTKPFAVSESGWPAETVDAPWPEVIASSEAEQDGWVGRLLAGADRLEADFIVWFFTRDLDQAWEDGLADSPLAPTVRLFRDTGLLDGAGGARSGMQRWRQALDRPVG